MIVFRLEQHEQGVFHYQEKENYFLQIHSLCQLIGCMKKIYSHIPHKDVSVTS